MDTRRRLLLALAATTGSALFAGCGFHLRGDYQLPFATLHIGLPDASELYAQIRRAVEAGSATRIVNAPADAEARLLVLANTQTKDVLSISAAGRVREFELKRQFQFRLLGRDDRELIGLSTINARRDITFSDEQVLSKETEEQLLWQDMQVDIVTQLLRRLAAAKR